MAVVYVANQVTTLNYNLLAKYGSVVFVTRGQRHPSDLRLVADIVAALADSQPSDYLAITGHRLECTIAVAVWLQMHRTLPLLILTHQSWHLVPVDKSNIRISIEKYLDHHPRNGRADGSV